MCDIWECGCKNIYRILVAKSIGKKLLGRLRRGWKDNIKQIFRVVVCEDQR
jgi:hypothetical protein